MVRNAHPTQPVTRNSKQFMTHAIHYRIVPSSPEAHLFEVTLTVARPAADGQVLSLPAWIPGSYMIRDFAKNIVRLKTRCGGQELATTKLDKQTWQCAPCSGPLEIRYEVYAWDLSVRSAHLDTTHGYFNGSSVFLRVHGQDDQPCHVEILPPEGAEYEEWRVATTLPVAGTGLWRFGGYRAADYDALIDHPVEMGCFDLIEFDACGVPHAMTLTGRHRADRERLARDLKTVCEYHIRLFGEPAPMDRYLFQVMITGDGYGGLEHRSSTSLLCSRDDLPRADEDEVSEGYRSFLGLCSHEYFHTWNIKRIKPAVFQPYDLSREVHTPLLWFFEGVTSYYDDLALVRSGLISRDSYLELLGQTITRVLRGSGRLKQPVADSSFDAWTKFYKQDDNAPNSVVSYYTKGCLIALALDLTLRTAGTASLDDVMRTLWQRHGVQGVTDEGLERLIGEVAGIDLSDFFSQALRGTDDLPLAELLAACGIVLNLRPADGAADKGGKPGGNNGTPRTVLGVRSGDDPVGARLLNVFDGGAAQGAGLAAGDVVIAVDGLRVGNASLEKRVAGYAAGTPVHVHAFRRDELMGFDTVLQAAPADTCYLTKADIEDLRQQQRCDAWLAKP
jgi:predicted metalloprotease with PDZ domain